jgi:polyhydroxybutyrate depolymerase
MKRVLSIGFLLFALGCSKENDPPVVEKEFDIEGTLMHSSGTRTFEVHLPPGYYESNDALSLVIGLHGGGGSADQFAAQSELHQKADLENFIVVYPNGLPNPIVQVRTWNAGKCCGQNASTLDTDDVGFISALIDRMILDYRVDAKRVYATGHSNGAMLSYRLADELSNKIAAIAVNAGNFQMEGPYDPARNVPVLQIISKLDQNVIYTGGMTNGPGGQYNPPIDSCLNIVAGLADCAVSKDLIKDESLYNVYQWTSCDPSDFEVLLYLTEDGGHSWPGGNKGSATADEPSAAFSNNDVIWEFFQNHPMP